MNSQQIQHLKGILLEDLNNNQEKSVVDYDIVQIEISSVNNHPADIATDLTTMTTDIALDEIKETEVEKINNALEAIKEGSYGTCVICNKEIPFERLEVIPTALTCVDHMKEDIEQ